MNILNNLIPHETIVCDDKDPSWFNKAIKSLNQRKKTLSKNTAKAIAKSSYYSAKDFFKKNWIFLLVSLDKTTTRECQLNLLNFIKVRKHAGLC